MVTDAKSGHPGGSMSSADFMTALYFNVMEHDPSTWTRNGKKRIVWRCVSRLEFGTKYCHNSPTLDEDKLHKAITTALNEYGAIRAEIKADVLELTELARSGGEGLEREFMFGHVEHVVQHQRCPVLFAGFVRLFFHRLSIS